METAISVQNLNFSYDAGRPVLKDISFEIKKGETVVFAGLSGCGKTTLCYILSGVIPKIIKGTFNGNVQLFGEDIRDTSLSGIAARVGWVFQDSDTQIVCTAVEDELAFGMENLCIAPEIMRERVNRIAERLRIGRLLLRNPNTLSGGEKKLVALASVLTMEPEIVILDEPMASLDEAGRAMVREAICELRREKRTVIVVEHDLAAVDYADSCLIIKDGNVAVFGPADKILRDKQLLRGLNLYFGDEA